MFQMAKELGVDLNYLPDEDGYAVKPNSEPDIPEQQEPQEPGPTVLREHYLVVNKGAIPKVLWIGRWSDGDTSISILDAGRWVGFALGRGEEREAFLSAISDEDAQPEPRPDKSGAQPTPPPDVVKWLESEGVLPPV